ncbi:MAG TPA: hypothetical protein VLH75_14435 [Longimicrobiales bacterium]|nr:hypothetical protein [Longimicrobiales bacterium]
MMGRQSLPERQTPLRVLFIGDWGLARRMAASLGSSFEASWIAEATDSGAPRADVMVLVGHPELPPSSHMTAVPTVAVVDPKHSQVVSLAGVPLKEVLLLGHDDHTLPEVLKRLASPPLMTPQGRLALRICPWIVRRSVEIVFDEPVPTLEAAVEALARGSSLFPRGRTAIASRLGCSADHLTRVASAVGLSWSSVHRKSVLLRMLHHRQTTTEP